jgi:hydroxymethylpyrimidine kinase/phosphomethylpyrimidine kinase/thiamine-phosphate diphosphorylase
MTPKKPIVWSIAGIDTGGGAGLSADQRAIEALGAHLCPVPAALTAQNSVAVERIEAVATHLLLAQLAALEADLAPRAIKTGLLGSADNLRALVSVVDRLRERGPLPLVVDPVLRASTGAALADPELLRAYREKLLPRACVITPNQREAAALLGLPEGHGHSLPQQARALQAMGAHTVIITGGDEAGDLALDWLQSPQACGWLALPRVATPHHHGTGCTFASAMAAAMAQGFVAADAAVLAKMLTTHALRQGQALGSGAGPVFASAGFAKDPSLLPRLSLGEPAPGGWPQRERGEAPGVYAIVDSAERVRRCVLAGVRTVQLRIKASGADQLDTLEAEIRSAQAAADAAGARLYINDHWQLAFRLGARALHLGQEDLLALGVDGHRQLADARARGVALGLSSHTLWELCRAAALQPDYIACGPVWPTTTKDMPWRPQGLHNLAWWAHMAGAPVVGIGGILESWQLAAVAAAGAEGGCVVRGLGADPALTLPAWRQAWDNGRARAHTPPALGLPHPATDFGTLVHP